MDNSTLVAASEQVSTGTKWPVFLHFARIGALILLSILIIEMIMGTLAESYGGAEFARRLIYDRWYFFCPLFMLFLYTIFSFFSGLPFRRHRLGGLLIQLGLILLGLEYLATIWSNSFGSMTLLPNVSNNNLILAEDIITITYQNLGSSPSDSGSESVSFDLPNSAFSNKLRNSYRDITLSTYLPFSEKVLNWTYPIGPNPETFPSSQYHLQRSASEEKFNQNTVFSLHPEAKEFSSTLDLPALFIHYLPEEVAPCFDRVGLSKIILWNIQSKVCFTPEEQKIPIQLPAIGKRFMAVKRDHEFHSFFPDFSSYPLTQDLNPIKTSPLRAMALNNFEQTPHLFLMGPNLAFLHEGKWVTESLAFNRQHHLQNLKLDVTLLHHTVEKIPVYLPQFIYPIQREGKLIQGKNKAVEIIMQGRSYWIINDLPLQLQINKQLVTLQLKKKSIEIPFRLSLSQVLNDGISLHIAAPEHSGHYLLSRNHPIKFEGTTFFQKSQENSTVLTVNLSSNHYLKYIGLFIAFLGLGCQVLFVNP